jgi:hypothetical protein
MIGINNISIFYFCKKLKYFFKANPTVTPEQSEKKKMQSQKQSQIQGQKQKPFCKVCFDAGKPIAEYSTHYVRNQPGGVVVCPTILNQQCKYCKKNGHTPKQCPKLEGRYNPEGNARPSSLLPVPVMLPENKNYFKSLASADALTENFPVMGEKDGGKIMRPTPVKLNVWASVVAKEPKKVEAPVAVTKPAEVTEPAAEVKPAEVKPAEEEVKPMEAKPEAYIPVDYSKFSWADCE